MLIETGLGGASTDWSTVQEILAATTRVCAYDRAGLGRSPTSGEAVHTSADLVADLHALLAAADIASPCVLVGHSTGAWQVSVFAATYPDEVSGAVYVDPRNPRTSLRFLDALGTATAGEPASVTAYRDGLTGFEGDPARNPEHMDLVAGAAEAATVETGDGTLFGSKPVVVLTAGGDASEFADLPPTVAAAMEAVMQLGYQDYLQQTTTGSVTVVHGASHLMFNDAPDAVVEVIQGVLAAARAG